MSSNNSAVICLSHQLDIKNNLSFDSMERLKKACDIFHKNKCKYLITTGWKYKSSLDKPLSKIMSEFAQENYEVSPNQIYEESNAKDTVGEAFFVKKNFFQHFDDIKILNVVTSNWHLDRAKEIFDFIFSETNDPKIIFYSIDGDNHLHEKEMQNRSIKEFREMTKSCKRGNLDEIYSKMLKYHTMYKD